MSKTKSSISIVKAKTKDGNPACKASELEAGTVFTGGMSGYGGPFLRYYDGVVDLSKPSSNWNLDINVDAGWRAVDIEITVKP